MCSYGEVDRLENEDSLDSALGTVTQSGSSVGTKGLLKTKIASTLLLAL